MMTRRFLLAAAAVTTAAAALPAVPALAVEVVAPAAPPPLPAWVVGRPDCFDWQIVRTATADEALREIALSNAWPCDCAGCEDSDCDFCATLRNLDVLRVPHMDAIENPTPPIGSGRNAVIAAVAAATRRFRRRAATRSAMKLSARTV
jgi:hypothetical protein